MALSLVASIDLDFQPSHFGVRALDGRKWAIEGSDQAVVIDSDLLVVLHTAADDRTRSVTRRWSESASTMSMDESGTRAVVADWPRVVVLDWSRGSAHEVCEFRVPVGDASSGTTAAFDGDDHILFVARETESSDDYHLLRGCISTGVLESLGQLPIFGFFSVHNRPSIEGFVVSADDGQHGTSVAVVARSGDVRLISDAGRFFADLSWDGQFCIEDGREVVIRKWPGMSEVARLDQATLGQPDTQSPWWFARFSADGEVLAWPAGERTLTILDPRGSEDPQLVELPEGSSGGILGVAGRDGRVVVTTHQRAFLFARSGHT